MIKIQNSGYPIIYQVDNSYMQPSTSGAVQWNGMNKCLEVSTGTSWMKIDTTVNISTDTQLGDVVQWAKKKMQEEHELERLAATDPTFKDLYDQLKEKQEQIKMVKILKQKELNATS